MSLSTSGSTKNASVSPALFLGAQWTDSSIVLEADTLKSPPWTPNRFSYALRGGASLLMRWEVQRNGAWSLGDSLVCARSPK